METNAETTLCEHPTQKHNPTNYSEALVMIPTLNEEEAIGELIGEAREAGFANILVVDGFSTDRTRDVAQNAGARVVMQELGKGKGCGIRTGLKEFLEGKEKRLCIIDGDGTNVPSCLTDMIPIIESGEADVVLGSRTRGPKEQGAMNWLTLASNLVVSFLLGAKFARLFTDVQTGYWAFSRETARRLYPTLQATGFEIEFELFVKSLKQQLRVKELPVAFRRRKGFSKFSFMLRMRNLYYALRFLAS